LFCGVQVGESRPIIERNSREQIRQIRRNIIGRQSESELAPSLVPEWAIVLVVELVVSVLAWVAELALMWVEAWVAENLMVMLVEA
jgi:hypothetical protein